MGKNSRYDTLRSRIRRQFSRSKTYSVSLSAGESELLFDIDDHNFVGNDSFLVNGPFNHVHISSESEVLEEQSKQVFTAANDNLTAETFSLKNDNVENSTVDVQVNGTDLPDAEFTVNHGIGEVTLDAAASTTDDTVSIDYEYRLPGPTVYSRKNHGVEVDIRTNEVELNDITGQRLIGYIRLEASDDWDGKVHVGNVVDSTELDILKMSGLLNIEQ